MEALALGLEKVGKRKNIELRRMGVASEIMAVFSELSAKINFFNT